MDKLTELNNQLVECEEELDRLYIQYAKLLDNFNTIEMRGINKQVDKIIRIKQEIELEKVRDEK